MTEVTKVFFIGFFTTLMLQFPPAMAFHKPGHIPPTGTCRDEHCREEKPCDEELLRELKAKRDAKLNAYREIVGAAEDTRQREAEAIAEAQKLFADYAKGLAESGVVKVGKDVFKIPDEIVAAYKEAKIYASDKPASEKFVKLTKMYLETLLKDAGYKTAVERAKWIEAAVSGLLMDAMVLTKLKEAEFHSEQAFKQWLLGYENLMEARHLEDRIRRLEAECRQGAGGGSARREEEDSQTSGDRDADAAQQMIDGWKKVEGGFEDAEGTFIHADMAYEHALSVIEEQQSQRPPALRWYASARAFLVKEMTEAEFDAEWNKFREPLRRACELVVKGMEHFHAAERQFYLLPKAKGSTSEK